jgi:hypothetical protein
MKRAEVILKLRAMARSERIRQGHELDWNRPKTAKDHAIRAEALEAAIALIEKEPTT